MLWTCTYRYRRITQNGSPWRTCNQFILDVSSMHRNSDSSGCGFRGADYSSSSPSRDFRAANNISQMLAKKMWVFQNLGLNNIGVSEQKKENLSSRKVSDIQNQPLQQSPLWSRRCQWLARSPENWPQFSSFLGGKLKSLSTGTDRRIYIYIYVGLGSPYKCICKILKCSHDDQSIYELYVYAFTATTKCDLTCTFQVDNAAIEPAAEKSRTMITQFTMSNRDYNVLYFPVAFQTEYCTWSGCNLSTMSLFSLGCMCPYSTPLSRSWSSSTYSWQRWRSVATQRLGSAKRKQKWCVFQMRQKKKKCTQIHLQWSAMATWTFIMFHTSCVGQVRKCSGLKLPIHKVPTAASQTQPSYLACIEETSVASKTQSHISSHLFLSINGLPNIGLLELIEHGGRTRNVRLRGYERSYMAFATNPAMSRTKLWVNQNKGHIKIGHIHPTVYSKNVCTYIIHEGG